MSSILRRMNRTVGTAMNKDIIKTGTVLNVYFTTGLIRVFYVNETIMSMNIDVFFNGSTTGTTL